MALDNTGEKFTPTGKQLSDRGTTVFLHSGVAMEAGAGLTVIPEPPITGDNDVYGRGSLAGTPRWVLLDTSAIPDPPLDDRYYIVKNKQYVDANELTFLAAFTASDIVVDPPVLGKDNLQEVLEELAKPIRRRERANAGT